MCRKPSAPAHSVTGLCSFALQNIEKYMHQEYAKLDAKCKATLEDAMSSATVTGVFVGLHRVCRGSWAVITGCN
jgi:hypothetical protein